MSPIKGLLCVLVFAATSAAMPEPEPECDASSGLWNNLVTNLDNMFWQPFMDEYRYVRYATQERPLHYALTRGIDTNAKPGQESCEATGVSSYASVVCVQLAARLGLHWPCSWLASEPLARALATLDECPLQTLENDKKVMKSLNQTLQRRQHCFYATRVLRCSYLQLYWVLPMSLAVGAVALPAALALVVFLCLSWCCSSRDPYQ